MAKTTTNPAPSNTGEDSGNTDKTLTAEEITAAEAQAKADADGKAAQEKADAEKAEADRVAAEAAEAQRQAEIDSAAEAQRLADEEAARQQAILDMSLESRMARAKDALNDALEAQNQINAIVAQRTKELDELIIEQDAATDKSTMSDIQFYLTRQERKREEKKQQRDRLLESGLDPVELIKRLDTRAPIDQKQAHRKVDPRSKAAHKTTA